MKMSPRCFHQPRTRHNNTMHTQPTKEFLASQGLSETFPDRFWPKINKDGPVPSHMPHLGKCWIWIAGLNNRGYGWIARGDGRQVAILAHVASWLLTFGKIPNSLCVLHHCDNRLCVNPNHLWLGTKAENVFDMDRKGRRGSANGELAGQAKLTNADVLEIRRLYSAGGISQKTLGKMFNVSERCVFFIVHRQHWTHI